MRVRAAVLNLLLAAGSLLSVLALAEAGLRLFGYAPARFEHTNRIANGRRNVLLDCYPSNPTGELDVDLRDPATRARYRAVGVRRVDEVFEATPFAVERRYNSLQFRGEEIPERRPGVARVALVGDSFTEGMGVREEDTCARVLHRRLQRQGAEVLNCGRRGYDFPPLLDLFEEVLKLEPDVVVYAMVMNDTIRSPAFQARQAYLNDWILDRGAMERGSEPVAPRREPRLFTFVRDRLTAWRVGRDTTQWYRDMYGPPNEEGWRQTQDFIRRMNVRVQERGGSFVLALWPLLVGTEGGYPFAETSARIAGFCATAGIRYVDLYEGLRGARAEELWVHPVDHHPNRRAHERAAARLEPVLAELAAKGRQ